MILLITLVRALTGLNPYSGQGTPPMYGDFECHRFWMETTHHYPPRLWYVDGKHMNTSYWPMDYPPLCAYAHWGLSQILAPIWPQALKLTNSYGEEHRFFVTFMRNTLIFLELVVLVPAAIKLLVLLYPK